MVEEPVEQADGRRAPGRSDPSPRTASASRRRETGALSRGDDAKNNWAPLSSIGANRSHRSGPGRPSRSFDHPADRLVGQSARQGLDEVGGREVAHPLAGVNGLVSEGDEEGLPGPPVRPDRGSPWLRSTRDRRGSRRWTGLPTRRPRRTHRASWSPGTPQRPCEPGRSMRHAKRSRLRRGCARTPRASSVGSWPPSRLGRETAHGTKAESSEPGFEVGGETRRCRAHDSVPMA